MLEVFGCGRIPSQPKTKQALAKDMLQAMKAADWGYIGAISGLYRGYIGIMESKMETTMIGDGAGVEEGLVLRGYKPYRA